MNLQSGQKTLVTFLSIAIYFCSHAQNEPVSQAANSMVDLLTGDFNYSLPVMNVPGPNGEHVPVSIHYHGGIRMDEEASWIGLGWSYNPGEITRDLRGVPDDWNNKTVSTLVVEPSQFPSTSTTDFYGPLYYGNCPTTNTGKKMDVASSSYLLTENHTFSFPDYDKLHVSGPGISGTMSARIFSFGAFYLGDFGSYHNNSIEQPLFPNPSLKRTHFYFEDEINASANETYSASVYSSATNRIYTGNCIEYFTNNEINTNYTSLVSNGFLDYRVITGNRRPAGEFDGEGIGAFQITSASGMVYHYSLPVYTLESEKVSSFELRPDAINYDYDNTVELQRVVKSSKYAVSWKLTAVTGPDYKDINSNGIADPGDTGYWIAYNYGKWTNDFNWRVPFFNYRQNAYDKRTVTNFSYYDLSYQTLRQQALISDGHTQRYYLNSIQTGTHTAYFIKEVRADNHAVKEDDNGIAPSLRLSKIVLVRNENIPLFTNSATLPSDTRFLIQNTGCTEANIRPHIGNYNANSENIKRNSLSIVEFTADYSLCKMVYNNINNTFTTSVINFREPSGPATEIYSELYKKFDPVNGIATSTNPSNSGKLTLTALRIFGPNYQSISPSYLFDYGQADVTKNPNYSMFKSDYNHDVRGKYTTLGSTGSCQYVDAWSLRKITTPLGGEILIGYESDKYEKANYGGASGAYVSPVVTFLIKDVTFSGITTQKIGVHKEVSNFINLPGILRRKIRLPYTVTTSASGCGPFLGTATKDSCSTGCGGWTAFTTTSGSTTTTQQFNFASTYGPTGCAVPSGVNKTLSYIPGANINGNGQGWGYVSLTMPYMYGGGVRVQQITFREPDLNQSYINEYSYENGVAGTEPYDLYNYTLLIGSNRNAGDPQAPPPAVTYGKVTVRSKSLNNTYNGKTECTFDNSIQPYHISIANEFKTYPNGPHPYDTYSFTTYTAQEIIHATGRPLSVKNYDNNNNIVHSQLFEYDWTMGVFIEEKFVHRLYETDVNSNHNFDNTFIKQKIKSRLKSITTYKDGIKTIEEYLAFDKLTGQVITKRITDPSSGIRIIDTRMAYNDYTGMGPKLRTPGNQNLLLAVSKETVHSDRLMRNIYGDLIGTGKPQLTEGSRTTWRQSIPVRIYSSGAYTTANQTITGWLPHKTYRYNGDATDANWREEKEITLFNKHLQPFESKNGVSNRYTATKTGYNQQYTLCSATDCRYTDFTFSGFEDTETLAGGAIHFGGEITNGTMRETAPLTVGTHTGKYIAKVPANTAGPAYVTKGFTTDRSYRASIWVHNSSPDNAALVIQLNGTVNGQSLPQKSILKSDATAITSGSWKLLTVTITVPSNYVSGAGTSDLNVYVKNDGSTPAYFDDFMFRPLDAELTGNVLEENTGKVLATLDKYGFATRYNYNSYDGRLSSIYVEKPNSGFVLQKIFNYNTVR